MSNVLLTLIMPEDVAQHVEDLLLLHAELVRGFTTSAADGHGASIPLLAATELVSGHSPRICIQTAGSEAAMRDVLALIKQALPRARVFYWLQPIIEADYL